MSLAWIRRSSRHIAMLLLLVSAFGLPHRPTTDDDCLPIGIDQHDESKHVFQAVASPSHEDHCAICHWTRWLKPAFSAGPAVVIPTDQGRDVDDPRAVAGRDRSTEHLPPRAPPSRQL